MNLNARLQKLEQQLPPAAEPKADLSALNKEELKFLIRHHGAEHPEEIIFPYPEAYYQPYNEMTPEERQKQLEIIQAKIRWED